FPVSTPGRLPHHPLRGLLSVHYTLQPACSRRHQIVTRYTEGFGYFVTSIAAPVASGWSDRRVGLAPTGKRRLSTAHTQTSPPKNRYDPPYSSAFIRGITGIATWQL